MHIKKLEKKLVEINKKRKKLFTDLKRKIRDNSGKEFSDDFKQEVKEMQRKIRDLGDKKEALMDELDERQSRLQTIKDTNDRRVMKTNRYGERISDRIKEHDDQEKQMLRRQKKELDLLKNMKNQISLDKKKMKDKLSREEQSLKHNSKRAKMLKELRE